jgi:hypothetical protein
MKEEKNIFALIVTKSIVRDISVVRRDYSTYTVKRKKQNNRSHHHIFTLNLPCHHEILL